VSRLTRRTVLALAVALVATPVLAHSTAELSELLGGKERYFQAFDMQPPDFRLSDADGRIYSPGDFRGKVVVLNFVYASCPDMCPLQAKKLAAVQEMVNQTPMKGLVEFVTITTDPANDMPDVMRAYGPAHGLDPANWTFLTTAPDQPDNATRKLVEAFDQGFSSAEAGTRIHGAVTHIIDMTGRWRANFYGLGFDPTNMVLFVNALTNDFAKRHTSSGPGFWGRLTDFFN